MVSFLLDAIFIIICICTAVYSTKQGFVHSVFTVIAAVAAILISMVFTPVVSDILYDNIFIDSITGGIRETVSSIAGEDDPENILQMLEAKPQMLENIYARYNVTDSMADDMLETAYKGNASVDDISRTIASPVASTISNVLAFALCFIVSSIVLKLVIMGVDLIFKFPVLHSANNLGGFLLGILMAAIIGFVYSVLVSNLVISLGSLTPEWFGADKVEGTVFVKFFASGGLTEFINKVL